MRHAPRQSVPNLNTPKNCAVADGAFGRTEGQHNITPPCFDSLDPRLSFTGRLHADGDLGLREMV